MIALWDAYWPALTTAVVLGVLFGAAAFRAMPNRRSTRREFRLHAAKLIAMGGALALAIGAIWHGPVGTADRFAAALESQAQQVLVNYEMTQVRAEIERGPLRRTILLAGPADDFQRNSLVEIIDLVPGVAHVRWADTAEPFALPLLAEADLGALLFFALGLLLAYLLELRRRYRAQWSW
jgi:hypothetical protein